MDTLKPCPFCGGTPKTYRGMLNMQDGWWSVRCDACRFDGPYDLGESGAIEQWNTRPVEDALVEACEEAWNDLEISKYDEYGNPRYHLDTIDRLLVSIAKARGEA